MVHFFSPLERVHIQRSSVFTKIYLYFLVFFHLCSIIPWASGTKNNTEQLSSFLGLARTIPHTYSARTRGSTASACATFGRHTTHRVCCWGMRWCVMRVYAAKVHHLVTLGRYKTQSIFLLSESLSEIDYNIDVCVCVCVYSRVSFRFPLLLIQRCNSSLF